MTKFKEALQSMVAKDSSNKLGAVTYEISKSNGVHTHWQFIPVPEETIRAGLAEAAFRVEAENLQYPNFEVRDPGIGQVDSDFFRAWIWTPPSEEHPQGSTKCPNNVIRSYPPLLLTIWSNSFGEVVRAGEKNTVEGLCTI